MITFIYKGVKMKAQFTAKIKNGRQVIPVKTRAKDYKEARKKIINRYPTCTIFDIKITAQRKARFD